MRFVLKALKITLYFFVRLSNEAINGIIIYRENVAVKDYSINGSIKIYNQGSISIGENFKANSGKNFNQIGGDTVLRLICQKNAALTIGDNVGISNTTVVCSIGVTIENNVLIGGGCKIWDTDFHSLNFNIRGTKEDAVNAKNNSILIKNNAFIGGGTYILKGVTIGEKSVIAAGSVVTKSVPNGEIWGGNPAKYIRKI